MVLMNKMFKTFLILLAVLSVTDSYAQKTILGSKEMPLEINLIVDSLQRNDLTSYNKILPTIKNIDKYARAMSKEDIFMVGKIEIYKTFLKNYAEANKQPIDGVSIANLRSGIAKSNDNFINWFLNALLKDSIDLVGNATYKEYLLQKNNNIKTDKVEYRKLEKKAELLQFWISKVTPEAADYPDTLKSALLPKMIEALTNIQNSFHLMAKESSMTPIETKEIADSDLKFFSVKDITLSPLKPTSMPQEQKSVDDILAPVLNNSPLDLPKPTQENWLDDENAPPALQNLPKPSNDAEWLQDF